ncbi:CoA-binding protein [Haloquadratum walsbyi]|jgi:Predicted CoA-binding protein|uniref:Putative CoA-binding protein n=1 Tax=Haloquadratum walsbyi J07HQW2 TaxID=1238425 RepID=U1N274_9EURY|nr:CoA-binding protein [Haloquadratum walsbyi]ERG96959.1 MAG: putative CoA-binding protein [Haloquadratum walsbyi J07HQW2]
MTIKEDSPSVIERALTATTIAVIGCSTTPGKPAHDVPKYLIRHGYDIMPINPFAEQIFDTTAYDSLTAVPDDDIIDIVNIFRPSEEVPEIIESVIERHDRVGDAEIVWLQRGIRDDTAASNATEAGIDVVQDRCLKVAHSTHRA